METTEDQTDAAAREAFMRRYESERLEGLGAVALLVGAAMGSLITWVAIAAWGCP